MRSCAMTTSSWPHFASPAEGEGELRLLKRYEADGALLPQVQHQLAPCYQAARAAPPVPAQHAPLRCVTCSSPHLAAPAKGEGAAR